MEKEMEEGTRFIPMEQMEDRTQFLSLEKSGVPISPQQP
jgi:hypothetical protein